MHIIDSWKKGRWPPVVHYNDNMAQKIYIYILIQKIDNSLPGEHRAIGTGQKQYIANSFFAGKPEPNTTPTPAAMPF